MILAVAAHEDQFRVTAGHHQAEHRKDDVWLLPTPPLFPLPTPPIFPPKPALSKAEGLGGRKGGQPIGVDVGLDVIDAQQGQPTAQSDPLGGVDADQQGPRQAWPVGHSHSLQVIPGHTRLTHGLLDDGVDGEDVLAGSYLWEDAAVAAMNVYLRGDNIGEDSLPAARFPALHHGRRRLVARCLNA